MFLLWPANDEVHWRVSGWPLHAEIQNVSVGRVQCKYIHKCLNNSMIGKGHLATTSFQCFLVSDRWQCAASYCSVVQEPDNDNDNENDTLKEVPHPSNEGLALQARVSGPWSHKKESVLLVKLARWQGAQVQTVKRQNVVQRYLK